MHLENCTCEYLRNPIGIDNSTPCLGWQIRDPESRRGLRQTAYHLLVASTPEGLQENQGDLWDSGRRDSETSTVIPYEGTPLSREQRCFWKVKVWCLDANGTGHTSDWSEPACFVMGLLSENDWEGPWIQERATQIEKRHPEHLWYRKTFELTEKPRNALLHVASSGYHHVYLNGALIDDRVLAPAVSRLDKRVRYVTYDVGPHLQAGTNVIGLWTGPGWSDYSFFKERGAQRAVRVQMNIITVQGERISIASGADWRCHPANSRHSGELTWCDNGGEFVEGQARQPHWNQAAFDDREWNAAQPVEWNVRLSSHRIEPSRRLERLTAQKVEEVDGAYRFDLGRNATGMLVVTLSGQQPGDRIIFQTSDHMETVENFNQRSEYVCTGESPEQYEQHFNYACGRYVTVSGLRQPPSPAQVCLDIVGTDLRRTGTFTCSSDLWNRIYETDLATFQATTIEGFTQDCPHRERMGYGEEHTATSWGIGLPNYASAAFYSKLVEDWMDVQEENGWFHHTAPHINKHYGGAMWSSAGLNVATHLYEATGDLRVLRKFYPHGQRWIAFLQSHLQNGILKPYHEHWGKFLGDWAAPGGRKERGDTPEAEFFNTCVFIMNLTDMAHAARLLGQPEEAETFEHTAKELRTAVHAAFFDAEHDTYMTDTQVQIAFALLTRVVPEDDRARMENRLIRKLQEEGFFDMGSSGLPVLLMYLIRHPHLAAHMAAPLSSTTQPSYGYFLEQGETAWPEYWEVDVPSRVHTCYTGVASWFLKSLCGIQPDPEKPGMRHLRLHPVFPEEVTEASATTESLYGPITLYWRKKAGMLEVEIHLPPNTSATLYLPGTEPANITEGGRLLSEGTGIRKVISSGGYVQIDLSAGRYLFRAQPD